MGDLDRDNQLIELYRDAGMEANVYISSDDGSAFRVLVSNVDTGREMDVEVVYVDGKPMLASMQLLMGAQENIPLKDYMEVIKTCCNIQTQFWAPSTMDIVPEGKSVDELSREFLDQFTDATGVMIVVCTNREEPVNVHGICYPPKAHPKAYPNVLSLIVSMLAWMVELTAGSGKVNPLGLLKHVQRGLAEKARRTANNNINPN